jgi:hypothetical protein
MLSGRLGRDGSSEELLMAKAKKKEEQAKRERVRKAQEELAAALQDLLPEGSFAEREQAIIDITTEVQKEITERELQSLADAVADEVKVRGKTYKRHQIGTVQYYSLAGPLVIARSTYREVGVRNGATIVPLELIAGLAERATPALARNIAHGYARHDMRTHCEVLREAHCCPPPRATAERIAKALAETAYSDVSQVEQVTFGNEPVVDAACGVTVGFDRTSVPMSEALPAGAAERTPVRRTPYVRTPPPPMALNWRMAYIGTVCLVDEHGEALKTYRFAGTAADDPKKLTERMRWQLETILRRAPRLVPAIVQDGAPEMWTLMREVLQPLKDAELIDGWHEAIDLPHLLERLGEAFKLVCGNEPQVLEYWKRRLLESDKTIDTIHGILSRGLRSLNDDKQVVQEHVTYITNNKDRMRYATLRQAGLPIGSGVTESTAKNVVNMRAKRSGQRWSVAGLRGVLNLRSLLKSERLAQFWTVFSRRYTATVSSLPAAA